MGWKHKKEVCDNICGWFQACVHLPADTRTIYHILIVTNINFVGKENHSTRRKMILTIFYHHVKGNFKDGKMTLLCQAKFNTGAINHYYAQILYEMCQISVTKMAVWWALGLSGIVTPSIAVNWLFVCHGPNEYCCSIEKLV